MMKYKVKEILFVATLYDAFILESEDGFFEQFMGEIYQYSLFSLPRITGVTSSDEAVELLKTTNFDLVILMGGLDKEAPIILSERIKEKKPDLPVYILLNKKNNIQFYESLVPSQKSIDELIVWSGDSQIFFSIVKSIEDKVNVENDTQIGLVRVILLIEDSSFFYSKYLQILFSIVFGQIQKLLPEAEKNELNKISKMRSRPKILHAKNYEDAMSIFNKYKDYMLCVISDVEFEKGGKTDKKAGEKFIKYVKSQIINLPVLLQSSESNNKQLAEELEVSFIDKSSDTLENDLKTFLKNYLGFGDFIFRGKDGKQIAVAKTLREFANLISKIPDDIFYLNAEKNQYSIWLMARGEIQLAKKLNPIKISDFETIDNARQFFIQTIQQYKEEKKKGKVLDFEDVSVLDKKNIVVFSGGSLGGKGRGIAFINTLIYNLDFSAFSTEINIRTPITGIIGTDEFANFIENNKLYSKIMDPKISYQELKKHFIKAHLSAEVVSKLESFTKQLKKPIAVRSSSLSEDSFTQPFAGVFDTYIVPNREEDKGQVLESLIRVIKMVYASVYSDSSRTYFKAINQKVEEEKMAIVIQELVGNRHGDYYYPHVSGVAQSYNYYPVGHMKPDEGYALAAVGLGAYVVDGWSSYRFSPKYPKIEMSSIKDLLNNSQQKFYAVDYTKKNINYLKDGELASLAFLDISEAEKHGTLQHCASVYNPDNDRVEPGLDAYGPRVINFANILKYDYIPFAKTIEAMLNTIKDALGSPVEIEYAVDLTKTKNDLPSFYLLQIKPMVGNLLSYNVDFDTIDRSKLVLYTENSLGNGEVNDISDIIFINNENFDKLKTIEMVKEIDYLNNLMIENKKEYILIGPGRWGTRDQFIGIPVTWPQISNAKVIVEISLADFPLESSLGSHFFNNVTSRNVGYFSILDSSQTDFINWEVLNNQEIIQETKYFKHIRFKKPLSILMNGRERTSGVIENE